VRRSFSPTIRSHSIRWQSVQVYIVSIALSTHPDTGTSADSMQWVTVAAPHRQVDLLTLQQGLTDSLGVGTVRADNTRRCSSPSMSTPPRASASRRVARGRALAWLRAGVVRLVRRSPD